MTSRLALSLLVALTGCPLDTGEPDVPSDLHDVTVSWKLENVDGTPMAACPAGFTTIYINLYRNPDGLVAPPDAELTLPCTPSGTVTRPVATAGKYVNPDNSYFDYTPQKDFLLTITEPTLSVEAARTSYYYVDALTSDLSVDFTLYPAGGVGVAAWSLSSSLTGAPLSSCEVAGVDTIEAAIRPFSDPDAPLVVVGSWPCTAVDPYQYYEPNGNGFPLLDDEFELGSGSSTGIATGEYFAELRAKRAGTIVGRLDSQVIIDGGNDANPFTPTSIPINDR